MPPAVASAAICHPAGRRRLSSTCSSTFHMRLFLLPCLCCACAVLVLCLFARATSRRAVIVPQGDPMEARWVSRHTVLEYYRLYIVTCGSAATPQRYVSLSAVGRVAPGDEIDGVRQDGHDYLQALAHASRAAGQVDDERRPATSSHGAREHGERRLEQAFLAHRLGEPRHQPVDHRERCLGCDVGWA